jgi:hypothetical protein
MPTSAVFPSILTHSWSFVYFNPSGMFIVLGFKMPPKIRLCEQVQNPS